ncbi:MAG: hypothetical protein ABEJ24_02110 [Candidatus Magasanikbacteria bacterium]
MRRVKNHWQNCGIVQEVRRRQYFTDEMSENMKHRRKIRELKEKKREEYLRKIGKLKRKGFDKFGRRID